MKTLQLPRAALAFVLLWALMAIFPPSREVFRAAWATKTLSSGPDPRVVRARLAAWHRQFPDSVLLDAWRLESEVSVEESVSGGIQFPRGFRSALREMDALSARFPNDLSLRAQQARMSLLLPIKPKNKSPKSEQSLTASDYALAARRAREAEKREPDNGFWPWTDAALEFAMGHQEASFAALERAARCPRYNSYMASTTRARAAWLERAAQPVWEEKQTFPFVSGGFYSLSMSQTLEGATEAARRAREGGDGPRAAAIQAAALGAVRVWRRSDSDNDMRVSDYVGRRELQHFLGRREPKVESYPGKPWAQTLKLHKAQLARDWGAVARQSGHPEWASRADFLLSAEADSNYDFFDLWRDFGLPAPWGRVATLGPLVLISLAALCWGGALAWLGGEVVRRITKRRGAERGSAERGSAERGSAERAKAVGESAEPTRGQVAACANFSAWSLGGTLAVCLVGLGWTHLDIWSVSSSARNGQMSGTWALLSLIVAASWLLPVAYATGRRTRPGASASSGRASESRPGGRGLRLAVWALFFLALAGLFFKIMQPVSLSPSHSTQMVFWIVLSCGSLAGALCFEWVRFRRFNPRLRPESPHPSASAVPRLMRRGLWMLAPVFGYAAWQTDGFEAMWLTIFGVAAFAAAFWLEWKGDRREGFAFALQLATRSAGVLALVWSLVFLIGCARLWPVRRELNRQFDRRLQIGERAWTREKSAEFERSK